MHNLGILGTALAVCTLGASALTFGDFEVTPIQDCVSTQSGRLFTTLSSEAFEKLAGGPEAESSINVFLIRRGETVTLCDTGLGGPRSQLPGQLRACGLAPADVDVVLLTHAHADHVGGLIDRTGAPVFPNATVRIAAPEWTYWMEEAPADAAARARKALRAYGGRVRTFAFGEEVVPGIKALEGAGHTPGHTVFELPGLLIVGDLLHAASVQFPRPEVCPTYDMDAEASVRTRLRYYDRAAGENIPMAGMHLPFPGIVTVRKEADSGYRAQPYAPAAPAD